MVFWFGDLNFRIEDYDIHVVKCAIDSNKLPLLWERDQVRPLSTSNRDTRFLFCFTIGDQQRALLQRKLSSCDYVYRPSSLIWLKTPSPSWKASLRGPFTSLLRTSLMSARTHTTPGLSPCSLSHSALTLSRQPRILTIPMFPIAFCIPQCQEEKTGLDRPHPLAPSPHWLPCSYPQCSAAEGSDILAWRGH